MSAQRNTLPDAAAAAEACANRVVSILDDALATQEFASFAISGGSSPRLMFQKLAAMKFPWDRIHIFWVDERCVPPTDPASNYRFAQENLIHPAHIPERHVHRIVGEIAPQTAAERYAAEIQQFFGLAGGDMPHFDLVHRGMGPDAHTASLFPGEPLIDDHEHISAAVFVPQFNQWRVTLLPGVLLAAKHTVVLAPGQDKQEALRGVFQEEINPKKYPSQIATRNGRSVEWFVDEAAAKLLD